MFYYEFSQCTNMNRLVIQGGYIGKILAAGFKQDHAGVGVFRQPVREHAAS